MLLCHTGTRVYVRIKWTRVYIEKYDNTHCIMWNYQGAPAIEKGSKNSQSGTKSELSSLAMKPQTRDKLMSTYALPGQRYTYIVNINKAGCTQPSQCSRAHYLSVKASWKIMGIRVFEPPTGAQEKAGLPPHVSTCFDCNSSSCPQVHGCRFC